jgi:hypothetical protein
LNTPTHLLVNVATLGRGSRATAWAAASGAVLPDLPIVVFYGVDKLWYRRPESEIWAHDYFVSAWQPVIDGLHSFPLIAVAALVLWRVSWGRILCLSLLLHSALDFPLHHDDAHRHLFPLSAWRFASPVSYWDPRHHGALGAFLELAALLTAAAVLMTRHRSWKLRVPVGLLGLGQTAGWIVFYAAK